MTTANESGLSNNGTKDVSISNVPLVGKRDRIQTTTVTPEGTTTATYTNQYTWEAADSWQEQIEQWLAIRHSHGAEAFATYAASRLWFKTAIALTGAVVPGLSTLGLMLILAWAVGVGSLCYVALRSPSTLAASSLRLLMIAIACI
jgi:hypothetical protein